MQDSLTVSSTASAESAPATPHPPPSPLGEALEQGLTEAAAALDLSDPTQAVHDLRKAFKRLRALLRLVQKADDKTIAAQARELRRALADGARLVAGPRDVAARTDALDGLVAKGLLPAKLRRAAGRSLAPPSRRREEDHLAPHRAEMQHLLNRLTAALPDLSVALGDKDLLAALTDEFGKARRIGRRVDPSDDEALHELRKAVVAQRYQMELVVSAWPAFGKFWVDELQNLRDKLGKHHDLSVLIARLHEHPPSSPAQQAWRGPVMEAAHARQHRLAQSALRLHRHLFAEKPQAFRRRLASYKRAISHGE